MSQGMASSVDQGFLRNQSGLSGRRWLEKIMDRQSKDTAPAVQQGVDWYGFYQGTPARQAAPGRAAETENAPIEQRRVNIPQAQAAERDPYGYHQGPGKRVEEPRREPAPSKDPYDYHQGPRPQKPGKDHMPRLTLYDVAESTFKAEGRKNYKQDDIYFRLNDMMVAHGFQKANIDGRKHINDHMLPKSWNYVDPRKLMEAPKQPEPPKGAPKEPPKDVPKEPPKGDDKAGDPGKDKVPQTPEEKARADYQKQVEAYIKDQYSLPPIQKGKGYYDAVAEAHPDWKPKQIMEEAKRIRHLNNERTELKVGERVSTISKEERDQMIAKAMAEYDEAQKKQQPQPQPIAPVGG